MKAKHRYPIPLVLLGILLSLLGGWAAASAFASMLWIRSPENKDTLVEGFRNSHFHFFPPLFGNSPWLYFATASLIVIGCFAGSLLLRRHGFPQKRE